MTPRKSSLPYVCVRNLDAAHHDKDGRYIDKAAEARDAALVRKACTPK